MRPRGEGEGEGGYKKNVGGERRVVADQLSQPILVVCRRCEMKTNEKLD